MGDDGGTKWFHSAETEDAGPCPPCAWVILKRQRVDKGGVLMWKEAPVSSSSARMSIVDKRRCVDVERGSS